MTGWINGVYSKYHCQQVKGFYGDKEVRCLKPAKLRKFRDDNVPMCDECYAFIQSSSTEKER